MNTILIYIVAFIISYLIGAIPNGVIIGKLFYHKDVREYGSHNSGGSNAGRVLGKKVGVLVIVCDALKIIIPFWIIVLIIKNTALVDMANPSIVGYICLIGACIGHCYSPYIGFKGGKAVATFAGCLLATNWLLFLLFISIFLIVLYRFKMVSLSSITASFIVTLLSFLLFIPHLHFSMWWELKYSFVYPLSILIDFVLLLWRHKSNIQRIKDNSESKITWM